MRIVIQASLEPTKGGTLARGIQIGVASRGDQRDDAIAALQRAAAAWCHGLNLRGELPAALDRRGITWERDGDGITVEVQPLPSSAAI